MQATECPFCLSNDIRTLYEDAVAASYRCHDCQRTFHTAPLRPRTTARAEDAPAAAESEAARRPFKPARH